MVPLIGLPLLMALVTYWQFTHVARGGSFFVGFMIAWVITSFTLQKRTSDGWFAQCAHRLSIDRLVFEAIALTMLGVMLMIREGVKVPFVLSINDIVIGVMMGFLLYVFPSTTTNRPSSKTS